MNLPELPEVELPKLPPYTCDATTGHFATWTPLQVQAYAVEYAEKLARAYGEECARMERERIAGMRSQFIKLAEAVEAAGYRRGLQGKPPSDYEPEICRLINAFNVAIRAETVSDGIQRKV